MARRRGPPGEAVGTTSPRPGAACPRVPTCVRRLATSITLARSGPSDWGFRNPKRNPEIGKTIAQDVRHGRREPGVAGLEAARAGRTGGSRQTSADIAERIPRTEPGASRERPASANGPAGGLSSPSADRGPRLPVTRAFVRGQRRPSRRAMRRRRPTPAVRLRSSRAGCATGARVAGRRSRPLGGGCRRRRRRPARRASTTPSSGIGRDQRHAEATAERERRSRQAHEIELRVRVADRLRLLAATHPLRRSPTLTRMPRTRSACIPLA